MFVFLLSPGEIIRLPKDATLSVTLKVLEFELFHICPIQVCTSLPSDGFKIFRCTCSFLVKNHARKYEYYNGLNLITFYGISNNIKIT